MFSPVRPISTDSQAVDLAELTTMVYTMLEAASQSLLQSTKNINSIQEAHVALEKRLISLESQGASIGGLSNDEHKAKLIDFVSRLDQYENSLKCSNKLIADLQEQLPIIQRKLADLESATSNPGPLPVDLSSFEAKLASLEQLATPLSTQFAAIQDALLGIEKRTMQEREEMERFEVRVQILEQQLTKVQHLAPGDALTRTRLQGLEQLVEQTRLWLLREEQQLSALGSQAESPDDSGSADVKSSPAEAAHCDPDPADELQLADPEPQIGNLQESSDTLLSADSPAADPQQVNEPPSPVKPGRSKPIIATIAGAVVVASFVGVLAAKPPVPRSGGNAIERAKQAETMGEGPNVQTQQSEQMTREDGSNGRLLPAAKSTARAAVATSRKDLLKLFCADPCWVEVSDSRDFHTLYQGMLKGPATFPLAMGLRVSSGRADILKVRVNDGPVAVLDPNHMVSTRLFLPPQSSQPTPPEQLSSQVPK